MTDRLELVHEEAAVITAALIGPDSRFGAALECLRDRRLNGEDVVMVLRRMPDGRGEIDIVHRSILAVAGSA